MALRIEEYPFNCLILTSQAGREEGGPSSALFIRVFIPFVRLTIRT